MNTPLPEREVLVATAQSLFAHSYSFGAARNIPVPIDDLSTPRPPDPPLKPKFGNFGSEDFFGRAVQAVRSVRRECPKLQEELA